VLPLPVLPSWARGEPQQAEYPLEFPLRELQLLDPDC